VRWNVAGNIVIAWVITFPAAAGIACVTFFAVRPLFN
jgi:PiT family inorganic phosphate transporter